MTALARDFLPIQPDPVCIRPLGVSCNFFALTGLCPFTLILAETAPYHLLHSPKMVEPCLKFLYCVTIRSPGVSNLFQSCGCDSRQVPEHKQKKHHPNPPPIPPVPSEMLNSVLFLIQAMPCVQPFCYTVLLISFFSSPPSPIFPRGRD